MRKENYIQLALRGILVLLLGIYILYKQNEMIYLLGVILLLMAGLVYLHSRRIVYTLMILILGVIHLLVPNIPLYFIKMSTCVVFMGHAIIHLMTAILHFKNQSMDFIEEVCFCLFYSVFTILVFRNPSRIITLFGIYFVVYGLCDLKDAVFEAYHIKLKSYIRHKVRIQLPVLLSILIPSRVLKEINQLNQEEVSIPQSNIKPDIEVLIHMTPSGYGAVGHVDLCINGYVITYGNYDAASYRLFDAIGEGVLMVIKKEEYIEFCKRDTHKTLVGFGLVVSDEKMKAIRKRIYTIFELLYSWECDYSKAKKSNDEEKMQASLKYYANRIYKATGAKMYKFKKSKFKTYFVFTTNCVLLADSILEKAGVDLLGINGIITPGTYYDYLNREFQKEGSFVVSRTIYQ